MVSSTAISTNTSAVAEDFGVILSFWYDADDEMAHWASIHQLDLYNNEDVGDMIINKSSNMLKDDNHDGKPKQLLHTAGNVISGYTVDQDYPQESSS